MPEASAPRPWAATFGTDVNSVGFDRLAVYVL
jgi:hypothetical protein